MANKSFPLKVIFEAIDRITAPLKTIRGSVSNFQNQLGKVGKKFDEGMGRAAKIGLAAQAVGDLRDQTLGMIMPAAALGREFEKTMSTVAAVSRVDLASEEFKNLEATARKLGATTSFSASEAAQGMTYLAMAGFNANQTIAAMPGMLSLAKAGNIDLARAADIASNTLGAFKMEASDMPRVSNALAATFTRTNTDLEMLAETFKYVAPVANSVGMSIEDLGAMTGLLGDIGIQGSQAGTALRMGLLRMATTPKLAAESLAELGINTKHTAESIAALSAQGIDTSKLKIGDLRGMSDVLEEIRVATKDMGSGDRLQIIKNIFGAEASAAFTELISKADSSGKSINNLSREITKAVQNNEVDQIATKMGANFDGAVKGMDSAKEEMYLIVYDILKPALTALATAGQKAFQWVGEFAKENPKLTTTLVAVVGGIAAVTAVIAPLLLLVAGIGTAVTTISAGWGIFTAALAVAKVGVIGMVTSLGSLIGTMVGGLAAALSSAISGTIAFTGALLANPITWVIVGIMALIAAIWLLWNNWDTIKTNMIALWETLKTAFSSFGDSIKSGFASVWESVIATLTGAMGKISALVPDFVKNMFSGKTPSVNVQAGGAPLPTGAAVAGGVANGGKSHSVVDVNFSNVPRGTEIQSKKPQKGLNLSMGYGMTSL